MRRYSARQIRDARRPHGRSVKASSAVWHAAESRIVTVLTWVSLFVTCAAISRAACQESVDPPAANRPAQSPVAITISAAATHITAPLRADGYPDFVAALNLQFGQQATPENNAAIPFWMAVGPSPISEDLRPDYFRMLGISPLPLEGNYFIDFERYVADEFDRSPPTESVVRPGAPRSAWKELQARSQQPWSARDYPTCAAWLAANREPLKLVVDASRRPLRYDPLLAVRDGSLCFALLPAGVQYGDVVQALAARAMLRLSEQNVEAAWHDLLACHRLAFLAAQGPTVNEAHLAGGPLEIACAGDQALLGCGMLTTLQIGRMRADLRTLPPWPTLSDKFDVAERLTYLNIVCDFARDGPAGLRWLKPGRSRAERESFSQIIDVIVRHSWETPIDWDLILRIGNAWFDRIVDAYRRDDDGIVVYSVGINRRDDGAKSYDDRTSVIDDWDDIVVRLPAIP